MKQTTPITLLVAIIFASSVISGSLVFFGMQVAGGEKMIPLSELDVEIEEGLDRYIKKINEEATAQQASAQQEAGASRSQLAQNVPTVSDSDHILGEPNAPFTLVEYSDFDCPFCERFHGVAPQIMEQYEGKFNRVYRNHPIESLHPNAPYIALASECVASANGNDAFWQFSDEVFRLGSRMNPEDRVRQASEKIGADAEEILSCADAGTYADVIDGHLRDGVSSGVQGTPGVFIINNTTGQVIPGLGGAEFADYKRLIDSFIQ